MKLGFTETAKRNISLVIILLISAVHCGSIDLSYDYFSSGGSIRGSSNTTISRSLIASTPVGLRENDSRSSGSGQNFEKASVSSDIFSKLARKLLQLFGSAQFSESVTFLRNYSLSKCIACCAYLFLLTHIRFIHLKDGSK